MPKVSPDHLDARRNHILESATRCIARKGLGNTTMSDILAEAGLSAGAVYHYFSGKHDILQAVLARYVAETRAATEHVPRSDHPGEQLRQMLLGAMARLENVPSESDMRLPLMLHAEALVDDEVAGHTRELYRSTAEAFRGVVVELQAIGRVDPDLDAEYLCWLAVCAFEGWRVMKLTNPYLSTARFAEVAQQVLAPLFGGGPEVGR